jgi:hypothetical protein
MEFRQLYEDAVTAGAADNMMFAVQTTNSVRALFASAKLL